MKTLFDFIFDDKNINNDFRKILKGAKNGTNNRANGRNNKSKQ